MSMNQCPQCGRHREKEEYKCPDCDCFYSQLDEILAAEEAELERRSVKGRLRAVKEADDSIEAFKKEYRRLQENTPLTTKIAIAVSLIFVFALVVSVM